MFAYPQVATEVPKSVFERILFVCVGNICRSPMAEYLLRDHGTRDHGATIHRPRQIASAGLEARPGDPADPMVLDLLAERGIDASVHRARYLSRTLVEDSDLVLVMEAWQQREIERWLPMARGKVHRLGRWGDFEVADPYQQSAAAFRHAYELIEEGLNQWRARVWN